MKSNKIVLTLIAVVLAGIALAFLVSRRSGREILAPAPATAHVAEKPAEQRAAAAPPLVHSRELPATTSASVPAGSPSGEAQTARDVGQHTPLPAQAQAGVASALGTGNPQGESSGASEAVDARTGGSLSGAGDDAATREIPLARGIGGVLDSGASRSAVSSSGAGTVATRRLEDDNSGASVAAEDPAASGDTTTTEMTTETETSGVPNSEARRHTGSSASRGRVDPAPRRGLLIGRGAPGWENARESDQPLQPTPQSEDSVTPAASFQ